MSSDMLAYAMQPHSAGPSPFTELGQQIGGALTAGVQGYDQGVDRAQLARQHAAELARTLQQTQQAGTTFDQAQQGKSLAALQEQAKTLSKDGAATGNEDMLRRAGAMVPLIGAAYNAANNVNLPIQSAPVGMPVAAQAARPAQLAQAGYQTFTPQGPTPDGSPLGAYSTTPQDATPAAPAIAAHNSLLNDQSKDYIKNGLMLTPQPFHATQGETFGQMDTYTDQPEAGSTWTAPTPVADMHNASLLAQLAEKDTIAKMVDATKRNGQGITLNLGNDRNTNTANHNDDMYDLGTKRVDATRMAHDDKYRTQMVQGGLAAAQTLSSEFPEFHTTSSGPRSFETAVRLWDASGHNPAYASKPDFEHKRATGEHGAGGAIDQGYDPAKVSPERKAAYESRAYSLGLVPYWEPNSPNGPNVHLSITEGVATPRRAPVAAKNTVQIIGGHKVMIDAQGNTVKDLGPVKALTSSQVEAQAIAAAAQAIAARHAPARVSPLPGLAPTTPATPAPSGINTIDSAPIYTPPRGFGQ